jgi:hypothetical protein
MNEYCYDESPTRGRSGGLGDMVEMDGRRNVVWRDELQWLLIYANKDGKNAPIKPYHDGNTNWCRHEWTVAMGRSSHANHYFNIHCKNDIEHK